ncbi:MAG: D-glycero-beta-D-manno-heptose-7-phosphate kinase [Desulfobulbaceae bacterium]|uniref:D-glycero-beta-D-manno-heptose-7-phosphate kinase n=1 Tax=Candidatus Desulfobia pelagia TaxID=2841692 RepID=A0A8J6NCJ8_9BACT|nr:D-glycero-beta-D-manno-heptose-7-phosphate kinase [Candidatus Desulfobia pelagia]
MDKENLKKAISRFSKANILVIGDIIVDHFIWGSVNRISPEAPVPVVNVTKEDLLLGGSANVLHNISAMGGTASLCGVIGSDWMGGKLLDLLGDIDSSTDGIIKDQSRPTTKKTRVVAQNQQVVRFDREDSRPLSNEIISELCTFLEKSLHLFDAVIISDYAKGVINKTVMDHLRTKIASHPHIPVIVDPKPDHISLFHGATIITPNNHEAEKMSGIKIHDDTSLNLAAVNLQKTLDCKAVLITRGESGMALLEKGAPVFKIPTKAKEVYDVTGAGDTVIASLALSLASGLGYAEASVLANYAAGIVVGKVGTATVSQKDLLEAVS